VRNAVGIAVNLQLAMEKAENRWVEFIFECSQTLWGRRWSFDGRLFQVLAAATGKARSPIVENRVSGTASAEIDVDRKRCLPGSPVTDCSLDLQ